MYFIFIRMLSFYEYVVFTLNLVAGIMSGIIRFIINLAISLFTLSLIHYPLLPAWGERIKFMYFDKIYRSYCSLIYNYHMHNNPVLLMFVEFITMKNEKNVIKSRKELLILRNKFYLAYFLTINRGLDLEKLRKNKIFKQQNTMAIKEEKISEDNSFQRRKGSIELSRIVINQNVYMEKNIEGKEKKAD